MRMLALPFSILLVCGCASPQYNNKPPPGNYAALDQIRIKQKFDTVLLTKENLISEQRKCVPLLKANADSLQDELSKFPRDNATVAVGHLSSSKKFVYRGTSGLCLDFSANRHPIYAAEAFVGTANPTGVPPDVTNDWHMKIAMQIALNGKAKVAYIYGNGNAYLVTYWSEKTDGTALNYSWEFKKIGEWENAQIDHKFSDPSMRGFSGTTRGEAKEKVQRFPLAKY